MQPYLRLMRADKPIGTWLLYYPCTWSIALATPAGELPNLQMLALFGAGAFFMRSAGCIVNDLWDKDFDKRVERTKIRPLASGELNEKQAISLLIGLLSVSFGILLQFNWMSVAIGAASLSLVFTYPAMKRFTYWPQVFLGLAFNYGAILGYTAVCNDFNWGVIMPLYLASICWTMIYDTIYAHQDRTDDIMIGVKSTALRFGENTKYWLTGFSLAMSSGLSLVGVLSEQTLPYYVTIGAITTHLLWQAWTVDINSRDDCWNKFSANRLIGIMLFLGISLSTYLKKTEPESKEEDVTESTIVIICI
uniref:4-hydroxybenzoate polyprenyltransferase, mitochondrial n=1 Tax=Acrobeloides nanus TaxID=290746 RepID=A0A914DNP0_9BILA